MKVRLIRLYEDLEWFVDNTWTGMVIQKYQNYEVRKDFAPTKKKLMSWFEEQTAGKIVIYKGGVRITRPSNYINENLVKQWEGELDIFTVFFEKKADLVKFKLSWTEPYSIIIRCIGPFDNDRSQNLIDNTTRSPNYGIKATDDRHIYNVFGT